MRKQNGITLIALVITIIVLLILATVSISAIFGDDGMMTKAQKAKVQTEIGKEKEQIEMAYTSYKLNDLENFGNIDVSATELQNQMDDSYGSGTVSVVGLDNLLTVTYLKTNREYLVLKDGLTIYLTEILENATPDMPLGIADDGTVVDMSNWNYTLVYFEEENVWAYELGIENCGWNNGYKGDIVDGKIEGKVPAYILENPEIFAYGSYESYFVPVLAMDVVL